MYACLFFGNQVTRATDLQYCPRKLLCCIAGPLLIAAPPLKDMYFPDLQILKMKIKKPLRRRTL